MKTFFIAYFSSLVSLIILDSIWLSNMIKSFYGPRLSHLTAEHTSYTPAIIFYILYAVGIIVFVVLPAISGNWSLSRVFLTGALLGLVSYGAYDFTNQATLKDWPTLITVVDLAWGTFLTGTASAVSFHISKFLS